MITTLWNAIPTPETAIVAGPLSLGWAFAALYFAGWLKRVKNFRTGDTRKIFHFLIFIPAAIVQFTAGFAIVCLFGVSTSLILLIAIRRGDGDILYEAIARENDAPHRTRYIVVPYLATLIGGLADNIIFGPAALVGYLVGGLGDAVGEPVGVRWGKHRYRVPSLVPSTRSLEGSFAVFVGSLIAMAVGIAATPGLSISLIALPLVVLAAFLCVLVEATSPHGWDNLTLQLAGTSLAFWWF